MSLSLRFNVFELEFSTVRPWKVHGSNGRCMVAMEGVWQQWKVYGSNGRCMAAMEGVW